MWIKDGIEIRSISDMPKNAFGFIYRIENVTKNKIYIGRKNLYTERKKKFGKRQLEAMTDKRAKKYEIIKKESNWLSYTGSNKELNEDIKNGDEIIKTIMHYAYSKAQMTYFETKYQFIDGVLEKDGYNDNILGRFYRKIFNI